MIFEAFIKHKIIQKYSDISEVLLEHLLKIIYFNDLENNEKHIKEMSGILKSLQSMKSKSKYPDKQEIYNSLFGDLDEPETLDTIINVLSDFYIKNSNISKSNCIIKLRKIYDILSTQLANKEFKTLKSIV